MNETIDEESESESDERDDSSRRQEVLEVIEGYEAQISELEAQVKLLRAEHCVEYDLHELIDAEGIEDVAEVVGVSVGGLKNMRSGWRLTRLEQLYKLKEAYPTFDVLGTIRRLGPRRLQKREADGKKKLTQGGKSKAPKLAQA